MVSFFGLPVTLSAQKLYNFVMIMTILLNFCIQHLIPMASLDFKYSLKVIKVCSFTQVRKSVINIQHKYHKKTVWIVLTTSPLPSNCINQLLMNDMANKTKKISACSLNAGSLKYLKNQTCWVIDTVVYRISTSN